MGLCNRKFIFLGLVLVLLASVTNAWGKKKEEKDEPKWTGKESVEMGIKTLQDSLSDPQAYREMLQMARDPEVMKEVEAMAKDPAFKKEMDKILNSDFMKKGLKAAEDIAKDPKKLALFQKQLEDIVTRERAADGRQTAQLGLEALGQAFRDPKAMQEAMQMLKDPQTVREVEAMMKDPAFQAEMRRITQQPGFKAAVEHAKTVTEELTKDPKKLKEFQRELEGMMGSFKNEL